MLQGIGTHSWHVGSYFVMNPSIWRKPIVWMFFSSYLEAQLLETSSIKTDQQEQKPLSSAMGNIRWKLRIDVVRFYFFAGVYENVFHFFASWFWFHTWTRHRWSHIHCIPATKSSMPSKRHHTWPLSIWKRHFIAYPVVLSVGLFTGLVLNSGKLPDSTKSLPEPIWLTICKVQWH